MSLPSEEEQARIILELERSEKLTVGEQAYVIYARWFDNWKQSVGYPSQPPMRTDVGPIDNERLFNVSGLRTTAQEGIDYYIVTDGVWKQLYEWYGGGPPIAKDVEQNPLSGDPEVIIALPRYQIFWRNEERPFEFSHLKTVGELKKEACGIFKCDPAHSRLVDFDHRERGMVLDDAKHLISYQFFDGHYFLLEYQRDDGQWISVERIEKKMPNSPSLQTIFATNAEPGLCGLLNVGNSCYLNTALQCLVHTDCILEHFLKSDQWRDDRNVLNPIGSNCEIVDVFVDLLREMWSGSMMKISPSAFKFTCGKYAKQFAGQSQQDGAEFLNFLLDKLHEDLNRVRRRPNLDPVFGNGDDDAVIAEKAWENHKLRNDSIIVDNFHGQLRSRLICPKCHNKTIVFDPFSTLTLPLPVPRSVSPYLIFVPYDITEPRVQMQLTVIQPPTLLEYVDSLSKRIGRKIHSVVFAERIPKATFLNWKPTLQPNVVCYAYEIPPHPSESVFACVRLTATRKFDAVDPTSTELDGIYLVELPSENATKEEVLEACQKRFGALWNPTCGDIQPELLEFKENLASSTRYVFTEGEVMKVFIENTPLDPSTKFNRERHYKFVTSKPIQVMLNPDVISDASKFNWSLLRRLEYDTTECCAENRQSVHLKVSLDMFATDEVLDIDNKWFCPHCREFVCANKKMDIWKLPNVLILHFKRFMQTASSPMKLETKIEYPQTFDMAPYVIGPHNEQDCNYKLFAAMYHIGELGGGHYVARAYHAKTRKWYMFDDSSVKAVPPAGNHTTDAYVVFYVKTAPKKPKKIPIELTEEMMQQMFIPRINVKMYDKLPEESTKPARRRSSQSVKVPIADVKAGKGFTTGPRLVGTDSAYPLGVPPFFVKQQLQQQGQK